MARMDAAQVFADLTRATEISRETGEPLIEFCALINMAEIAYAMEDLERASATTERSIALARQLWGEANRELGACELLLARIALLRGSFADGFLLMTALALSSVLVVLLFHHPDRDQESPAPKT